MKSIFRTSLVLALTVFASASFAQSVPPFIKAKGEKMFSVHHNTAGKFKITIKDVDGSVVYAINGNKNKKFVKTFDVKNLPTGTYTLETMDAENTNTYSLQITSLGLDISKNQALIASK